jgi:hypothetical protein
MRGLLELPVLSASPASSLIYVLWHQLPRPAPLVVDDGLFIEGLIQWFDAGVLSSHRKNRRKGTP